MDQSKTKLSGSILILKWFKNFDHICVSQRFKITKGEGGYTDLQAGLVIP